MPSPAPTEYSPVIIALWCRSADRIRFDVYTGHLHAQILSQGDDANMAFIRDGTELAHYWLENIGHDRSHR